MLQQGYILEADLSLMKITDDPQEAIDYISKQKETREVSANFV